MKRRLPSLNALRAFEAAGRHGRMIAAADELHVTHGAISRQVRNLEAALGVALFEGPKQAPRLTEAGQRLLPGLVAAFDQIEAAVRLVADTGEGRLDISCLGTFTMRWLIPRLHRFQARHAAIQVHLTASDAPIDFGREGCDLAIRVGRAPWSERAEVWPLFEEVVGPVMRPDLVRELALQVPQDLQRVRLLHTLTRRHAWSDWCARVGVDLSVSYGTEYEHFYFMLEAATAGLGACIAPWPLVVDDVRAGRLAAPFGFLPSQQTYVILRRPQRDRRSSAFCQWLQDEARTFEALDLPQAVGSAERLAT